MSRSEWITIQVRRPEGYEDVCDELVYEDATLLLREKGWEVKYVPMSTGDEE